MDGSELDCCEVNGGRPGDSDGVSLASFHVILEGFSDPIGEMPPAREDDLTFPSILEIIQ